MSHRGVWQGQTGLALLVSGTLAGTLVPQLAWAGAWNPPKGHGQVIVKYEPAWSVQRFNADGVRVPLAHERTDEVVSVWAEYGLTDRVTMLLKSDWQDSDDGTRQYRGMGPTELGVRYRLLEGAAGVASVQASYVTDSQGRNAAWGSPGEGAQELDLRFLAGRSFVFRKRQHFAEVQIARRWRDSLPDETRIDATLGVHISSKHTLLSQIYTGQADAPTGGEGARWTTSEVGIVRHADRWSAQLGWRATVGGRNANAADGPIVALWRRF